MNKKTHAILLLLLFLFILYLSIDKIIHFIEPFKNQIIIHPDGSFNPQETTFSVLTYDKGLDSGYTQASICTDDNSWKKGTKNCRDYSLTGSNCDDIGDDGRSALDACKVACDNCIKYEPIKKRLPSPIEDTEEPSYAQFESSDGSDGSGNTGSVDFREVINRLDEIDQKMEMLSNSGVEPCTTDENTPYPGCDTTCTDLNTPYTGCTQAPCTTDANTPYTGCDTTCTDTDTPYAGCTQAPCTTDANTPYTGCDTTCTAPNTPYAGCTAQDCTATDTPYVGCTAQDCTTDANTPYTGCIAQDCTATDTPYAGCTEIVGMCSGNTDLSNDITCPADYRLLDNSDSITGLDDATCCTPLIATCTNHDGQGDGNVSCPAGTPGAAAGWTMPGGNCTGIPCDMSAGSSDVAMCCGN